MPRTLSGPQQAPAPTGPARLPQASDACLSADGFVLDAHKLDCYHVACEFQLLACTLVPVAEHVLRDQLERASVGIVLTIAEGAGRRSRRDKARFYTMARGSAMECAAVVDLLYLRALAPVAACQRARSLLVRLVQMLTKLQASLA